MLVGFLLDPLFHAVGTAQRQRLDEVEQQLQAQLERLTGGLAPEIKLPKIKL